MSEKIQTIDEGGNNLGVLARSEALNIAKDRGLDLIQVSSSADGSYCTCIIQSLSKYKYEKQKKLKKASGSSSSKQKEWWFKSNIQDRDIKVKLEKVREYLEKGGIVKIVLKASRKVSLSELKATFDKIREKYSEFAKEVGQVKTDQENINVNDISVLIKLKK